MKTLLISILTFLAVVGVGMAQPSGQRIGPGPVPCAFTNCTINNLTVAANGTASVAPLLMNGTIFTGGTGTTNFPALFIQPSGTTAATNWNTSGTGLGINLASGFAGDFINLKVNGASASKLVVDSSGNITAAGSISITNGSISANGASLTGNGATLAISTGSSSAVAWTTAGRMLKVNAANLTDTNSSGTVAATYANAFKAPTLLASSATTYTNSYNTYFETPVASTNVTQTNAWALGADSLKVNGTVNTTGQIVAANMTQTSAAQSGTVCFAAAGLTYDATLGCLASLPELKNFHGKISNASAALDKITPMWASWKTNTPEWKGGDHEIQPVFNAREVAAVDKRLVSYGKDGKLRGVRYMEMAAYLWAVNKELKAANDKLERRVAKLEGRK